MHKYIKENIRILSVTLSLLLFPHLVLALPSNLDVFIDKKIEQMTIDEKVGQLFIVGFTKTEVDPELKSFIQKHKPGSFLLFKRNIKSPEQVTALNEALYRASFQASKLPPLIAIDQEGGAVSRLPIIPAPPNALAIGQTESPLVAEEMGFMTGRFLREVGFNMNLAPVLDIADPLTTSFIGVRSFGSNPELVKDMGVAYSKGLIRARVIPTAKHFPGTGNLLDDPHLKVAENKTSLEILQKKDLKPYRGYATVHPSTAVMLSHFIYPALDDSGEPASFSKKIIQNVLRNEIGYKGLVITDDLQMQGSRQLLRPEAAALKALQAGVDIVMLTYSFTDQVKSFDYVKSAVQRGDFSVKEIDQKLRRILLAKAFANLYRRDPKSPSLLKGTTLTSLEYKNLEKQILEKNLKSALLPRELPVKGAFPLRNVASVSSDNLCVLSPTQQFIDSFSKASSLPAKTKLLPGNIRSSTVAQWLANNKCSRFLFVVTGTKTASIFHSLNIATKRSAVVVNLAAPRLFSRYKSIRVLNLYFNHEDSGKKVGEHLKEILANSAKNVALY